MAPLHFHLSVGGEQLRLSGDAAIRHVLGTMLRDDPSDGAAYRLIGQILHGMGRTYEAQVCCAGSLVQAIGADRIDLSGLRVRSVDEAVAAGEAVRRVSVVIGQELRTYRPSRSFDGSCPPALDARPARQRPYFVAAVEGGRCVVGNVGYAVFTRAGTYLSDFCSNDGRVVAAGDPAKRAPERRLAGTVLVLANAYANGNFHWMFETLPRLLLAQTAGYGLDAIDHVLVRPLFPHQIEALERLGVPRSKLVFTHDHTNVVADRLIVTSNVESYDHAFQPPSIEIEGWICRFLSTAFRFPPAEARPAGRRLHISRKKAAWRNLVNQDDVNAFLERNGFETVYFEDMSLADKHRALNGADVVAGLFGAGFTHLPFCRPGTRVILFYPEECVTDSYWTVCNHMGLEHFHVIGESVRKYFPLSQAGRNFATVDTLVNLDHLRRTLQIAGVADVAPL